MRVFHTMESVSIACLDSSRFLAVSEAVGTMEKIFGVGFDTRHGFVVLFEQMDVPEDTIPLIGCGLGSKLETTWRRHGCLIGLTLWGNSGDGVTWICPEIPGYAPQIQEVLRGEL